MGMVSATRMRTVTDGAGHSPFATAPSVCATPVGAAPVPMAYPTVAPVSSAPDATKTAPTRALTDLFGHYTEPGFQTLSMMSKSNHDLATSMLGNIKA